MSVWNLTLSDLIPLLGDEISTQVLQENNPRVHAKLWSQLVHLETQQLNGDSVSRMI